MSNRAMSLGEDIYKNYQKRCGDILLLGNY